MIQPLRGPYLSCTQKREHYPGQIGSCICLPPSLTMSCLLYLGLFFFCVFFSSALLLSLSLQSFPCPSLLQSPKDLPSLQELDSLSHSLNDPPSLARSTGQHSLKDAYHYWEEDELCFWFNACAMVCGAMHAFNNVCKM